MMRPFKGVCILKAIAPVLLLCVAAATPAFCQSTPSSPANPDPLSQSPPNSQQPDRDFSVLPQLGKPSPLLTPASATLPIHQPQLGNTHIDPQIIVRPPQSSFTQQTPRPPISRNLYPNLRILPIEVAQLDPAVPPFPRAKAEPIPKTWPGFKMASIPIKWEGSKITPIQNDAESSSSASTKR